MTALRAHTCHDNTSINHTFNHHHNFPPNLTNNRHTRPKPNTTTSEPPKSCHCHASTEAYCPALRRVSRKSRRRFIISSSPEPHALLRAALMMRYALTLSLPPLLLFRNRCARGLSEDHLLLELLQSDESGDGPRAIPRRPCGRSLQLE